MREKIQTIDYIGFTFNGTHSSQLGIVRTSNGSRFNENLLPTIQDKTLQVPGGDGTYYFGSFYTQRQFSIQFAFEDLTEQEFTEFKNWIGDKEIHELIFDELPYKAYQAKITGTATIKHIPFEEGVTNRIYKGEGSIQFTAYYPYAKSKFKFLNECEAVNKNEWAAASGLKESNPDGLITFDSLINQNKMWIYNPGDIEANFQMRLQFDESGAIPKFGILLSNYIDRALQCDGIKRQGEDVYIQIDTKLNLIEGLDAEGKKTGNVYNKYMRAGQFFKIPKSKDPIELVFNIETGVDLSLNNPQIFYDFYYI